MSLSPLQIIQIRWPTAPQTTRHQDLIDQATLNVGTVFGEQRNYAIALLTMHWLSLDIVTANSGGQVYSREKEGQLEREISGTINEDEFMLTRWGRELIKLRKSTIFSARTRMI